MIFELADHVQSFLSEHNKPPPKSFHEEMLERRAQEEQRRLLEAKQKVEQEVRPLSLPAAWPRRPRASTGSYPICAYVPIFKFCSAFALGSGDPWERRPKE